MSHVVKNRILGIAFVALMLFGLWSVYAIFNQKFTAFDNVTMKTSTAGLNLPALADVKVRGEIIGQVRNAESKENSAVLTLGIYSDKIGAIPENVKGEILPKTLFGEKYVSLNVPANPSSSALRAGDTIEPDPIHLEVEDVLNDLYPLLTAVQPGEINTTLNAIATALEGRGDAIGNNIEVLDGYLKRINPKIPKLIKDLQLLSTVSETYADAMPDIAATLRNSVKTGNTLLEEEKTVNAFLKDAAAFSNTAETFLDVNGDNIIQLGKVSKPTLELLARYSPEFPCLLNGIVNITPRLSDAFRGYVFHIELKTLKKQPRGYNPGDTQVYGADLGPVCGRLPNPPWSESNVFTRVPDFNDGVEGHLKRSGTGFDSAGNAGVRSVTPGATAEEKALVNSFAAPLMGVPADEMGDINTLLFAPIAKGQEVSVE